MSIISLIRLILGNLKWLLPMGVIVAATAFHLTKNEIKEYESNTIVNTGLVSGYNIESGLGGRIDFGLKNFEMENILGIAKSRETKAELAAQLLTHALMQKEPSIEMIGANAFNQLKKEISDSVRNLVVNYNSFDSTLVQIKEWRDRYEKNAIKDILESGHSLFGIEHLESLTAKRESNSSDMIKIAYTTTDPSVCRNTLTLFCEIFITKYRQVKEGQSSDVVAFFQNATQESSSNLNLKENNMLSFMVENKIINYNEQTSFIAAKKEDLDEMYFKEMMQLAAADSSRRNLEEKLNKYINLSQLNQSISKQRSELSKVAINTANLEISALDEDIDQDEATVSDLKKKTLLIKKELHKQAEDIYKTFYTPEGIEVQTILNQWLNQIIIAEQCLARLNVFKDRKKEFDVIYGQFAPWGSKIKRLEREIELAEKAYLENLHSYNQARLHRYNTQMLANLRIVEAPILPDKPNPSKRASLIMMGFMAGFLLPLVGLIIMELLDKSLRTPENAIEKTGLDLLAALPKLPPNWEKNRTIDYRVTMQKATNQLIQNIKIELRDSKKQICKPPQVAIAGTRGGEGKSFIVDYLNTYNSGLQFTELPALLSENYSADLETPFDFVVVIINADFTWNNADKKAISAISKVTNCTCSIVLNNVRIDNLESSLGEIPKRRSAFRIWLKKMLSLNLAKS